MGIIPLAHLFYCELNNAKSNPKCSRLQSSNERLAVQQVSKNGTSILVSWSTEHLYYTYFLEKSPVGPTNSPAVAGNIKEILQLFSPIQKLCKERVVLFSAILVSYKR